MWKLKSVLTERQEDERLWLETYEVKLTRLQARNLEWTILKHSTAVVMEDIQRQILSALKHKEEMEKDLNNNLIV